jgi:hypothetical protein
VPAPANAVPPPTSTDDTNAVLAPKSSSRHGPVEEKIPPDAGAAKSTFVSPPSAWTNEGAPDRACQALCARMKRLPPTEA